MKNKKDILEKRYLNAEARMIKPDFKVFVEKRSEEGMEGEKEIMIIEGVGIVLDVWTDIGWFREKINPNAFAGADMSDVVSLFNHDENEICSRTTGKMDDMNISIANNQVKYRYTVKNECSEKVYKNIELGFVKGSSYLYIVKKDSWNIGEDGVEEREILEIEKVFEMGPVTFPAYETTSVAARSRDLSKPKPKTGLELREQFRLEKYKQK